MQAFIISEKPAIAYQADGYVCPMNVLHPLLSDYMEAQ